MRLGHHGQDREYAHAVGDEVRGVFRTNHTFAQGGGGEGFEIVHRRGFGVRGRNQFDQVHVARWIEEMHAAEAFFQFVVKTFGQFVDRQAGGVGGKNGVRREVRCHFRI